MKSRKEQASPLLHFHNIVKLCRRTMYNTKKICTSVKRAKNKGQQMFNLSTAKL